MQERAELYMARTCPAQDLYRALTGARADSLHNSYHGSTGLAQAPYKNRVGRAEPLQVLCPTRPLSVNIPSQF